MAEAKTSAVIGHHSAVGGTGSAKHEGAAIRVSDIPKLRALKDEVLHAGAQLIKLGLHQGRVPVHLIAERHFPKNGMVFHRVTGERHLAAVAYLRAQAERSRGPAYPPHLSLKLDTMARQHQQLGTFHVEVARDILMHRRGQQKDAELAQSGVRDQDDDDEHSEESLDDAGVV